MQLSETVVAAMIGAMATVSTALFQLFSALRSKNKFDVRPKRGRTVRSVVAVIALMMASGVGGYLYSELRQQHAAEDIRGMRDELNAKLQTLAATTERLAAHEMGLNQVTAKMEAPSSEANVEAVVYAPACDGACSESTPQRLTLCGALPAATQVRKVELFAKPASASVAWDSALTNFDADIGGGKFVGAPSEHSEDETHKAVCVDFLHWSTEAHLARLVLQYGANPPEKAVAESAPSVTASSVSNAHIASMTPIATPQVNP